MTPEELRDLQDRVEQIQALANHSGWTLLRDRVAHTVEKKAQRILSGKLDHDEYIKMCAYLDGVDFVLNIPRLAQAELDEELSYQKELEEAEDEDEA